MKYTARVQPCDSHHHLGSVTGIERAKERGEGKQEHSGGAAQRRESRKQKVSVQPVRVAMQREREHQKKHEWLLSHS